MPSFNRSARAVWEGGGKSGKGRVSAQSGAIANVPYAANMRFGDEKGTNPEELIGAAHASCFAMALAFALERAGFTAESLEVDATVTVESLPEGGFKISKSALKLRARVPGLSADRFQELADGAKKGCPVSKALNAEIALDANLA